MGTPTCETLDLATLDGAARAALLARLPGDRAALAELLFPGPMALSRLVCFSDPRGVAGWVVAQIWRDGAGEDAPAVLRLSAHQPAGAPLPLHDPDGPALAAVAAWADQHPAAPLHLLHLCPDPATFTLVARHLRSVTPSWRGPDDAAQAELAARAADAFGLSQPGDDRLVRAVPPSAATPPAQQRYWQRNDSPAARTFQARVPAWAEGDGLVALAALDRRHLARRLARLGGWLSDRGLPVATPRPEARGHVQQAAPDEARQLLAAVPLLADVSEQPLAELAASAVALAVSDGQPVLVSGQDHEGLYVVTAGRMQVALPDEAGGEVVVDVLEEGAVFGEIGLVLGGTCTATVRADGPARLLRVHRTDAHRIAAQHAELSELLWQTAGRRLLTNRLLDDRAADASAIAACTEAAAAAGLLVLDGPEPLLPGHYFVVAGEGRVRVAETWFQVQPGARFKLGAAARLAPSGGPVRLLVHPPVG